MPVCGDLTNSASSAHFSFSELSSGHYSWAIIRDYFLAGGEWAIPVPEKVRARELSLHPAGMDPASKRSFEERVSAAIDAIRSRRANR